jgi:hypothetical protein
MTKYSAAMVIQPLSIFVRKRQTCSSSISVPWKSFG